VRNSWALLDFGNLTAKGSQQYVDTDEAYGFDSDVSNGAALSEGDYCLVTRRSSRSGSPVPHFIALIADIVCLDTGEPYSKITEICPSCQSSGIKPRTSPKYVNLKWRCQQCRHQFPDPAQRVAAVRRYRAVYSKHRIDVTSGRFQLSVSDLAAAEIRSPTATARPQLSIRRIDIAKLIDLNELAKDFGDERLIGSRALAYAPEISFLSIEQRVPGTRKISEGTSRYNAHESTLVQDFASWLLASGVLTDLPQRMSIPSGVKQTFFADLWIPSRREIVEAKVGRFARDVIRMGIGQVLDYCHLANQQLDHTDAFKPALLLDERPPEELVGLISSLGISLYFRTEQGFKYLPQDLRTLEYQ
jgi:hypothetical protein